MIFISVAYIQIEGSLFPSFERETFSLNPFHFEPITLNDIIVTKSLEWKK